MKLDIAILPGDGIGPEVTAQAVKAIEAVCGRFGHSLLAECGQIGACAIDSCGEPFPDSTQKLCERSAAVLFGAVGDPRYDNDPGAVVRPEQGLLQMRRSLGLYANLRPVQTWEALLHRSPLREEIARGVDFVCVRELTGGMYFGRKGRTDGGDTAFDTNVYSRMEVERILRFAFGLARKRRRHLTVVDKANVLETSRLWRQVAQELAPQYPEVALDFMYVDNAAMRLVSDPRFFDVLVTENTFGDILTDEASCIPGSMGLLASASLGGKTAVYEPIHGSYPQAAGKGIANPLAAILSAAMMLEYSFGLPREAAAVRSAVESCLEEGTVTEDLSAPGQACSTSEVGERVAQKIASVEIR